MSARGAACLPRGCGILGRRTDRGRWSPAVPRLSPSVPLPCTRVPSGKGLCAPTQQDHPQCVPPAPGQCPGLPPRGMPPVHPASSLPTWALDHLPRPDPPRIHPQRRHQIPGEQGPASSPEALCPRSAIGSLEGLSRAPGLPCPQPHPRRCPRAPFAGPRVQHSARLSDCSGWTWEAALRPAGGEALTVRACGWCCLFPDLKDENRVTASPPPPPQSPGAGPRLVRSSC